MNKEESWKQFWNSGRIEDYLSYSMTEKEDTKQEKKQEETDYKQNRKDYFM